VRLLWDQKFLYVRFICQDNEIYSPFTGRDRPHYQGDVVEVFLDPVGDSRQYVELQVSPRNQVFDQLMLLTGEPRSDENLRLLNEVIDRNWWTDLGWTLDGLSTATSVVQRDGKTSGWIADIAIRPSRF
jgi:hypothetical protein